MGLLLGGSILTLFELFDVFVYNTAWKTGHSVSRANKLKTNPSEGVVVVNGKESSDQHNNSLENGNVL